MKMKKVVRPEIEYKVGSIWGWLAAPFIILPAYIKCCRTIKVSIVCGGTKLGEYKMCVIPKLRRAKDIGSE